MRWGRWTAALCAPQQILFGVYQDGSAVAATDWIAKDEHLAAVGP